ncbi:hypothetical protein MNBD_BACTEROID02-1546 [hydrothermal vent metagenome]|uniref:Fibronectin type-III domain-containing protein n=1 Tax=hydrothermal vent metagenome TaxID=652676 RepID=A0A3B0QU02_9ZZZZ
MKKLTIILVLTLLYNCSSSSDDGGSTTPPVSQAPAIAVLTFPDNNQECNQGIEVNATQSSVTFTWNASANTDSYDIVLKNLDTNSILTFSSNTNDKAITIDKATPYSWYVVSKSITSTETAQSATWKFYNSGDPVESFAPFPADLIAPTMGANLNGITTVTLEWSGSDIDNDITGYDVFIDTTSPPTTQLGSNQTETTIDATVTAGNVYYWRVIITDSQGNNSESEIFSFRVD